MFVKPDAFTHMARYTVHSFNSSIGIGYRPICSAQVSVSDWKKLDRCISGLPDFPLSVSHSELQREQRADRSLDELFGSVLTPREVKSVASGYFLQDGILMRKWVPHGEDFVGDSIFQVVVPSKFRGYVLKLAHDGSGHLGVHKTYDRILRHFFWPRLKKDVSLHIKNCSICQLTGKPNQVIKLAPSIVWGHCPRFLASLG